MLQITKVIYKSHTLVVRKTRASFHKKRLELYRQRAWREYSDLVSGNKIHEDQSLQLIVKDICGKIKLSKETYEFSVQYYQEKDDSTIQALIALRHAANVEIDWMNGVMANLSKEQTLDLFRSEKQFETDLIVDAILTGEVQRVKQSSGAASQVEVFMETLKARALDKLVVTQKIDPLEYQSALAHYTIEQDPMAFEIMQENYMSIIKAQQQLASQAAERV